MSTTRRKFLQASMLGAVFVVGPVKSIFSQSGKDLDAKGALAKENDVLGNYSKAAFSSYVNSIFELQTASGVVEVTLVQVDDLPSPKNGECFSLLFRGSIRQTKQDTYVLKHASLGTFALLLVPVDADRNGAPGYLATINRLSFGDVLNNPAPSRVISDKPSRTRQAEP